MKRLMTGIGTGCLLVVLPGCGGSTEDRPTGSVSSDLVGIWDVQGSQIAMRQGVTIDIRDNGISLIAQNPDKGQATGTFTALSTGSGYDVACASSSGGGATKATRSGPASNDRGALPIDVGGIWTIGDPVGTDHGCTSALVGDSWNASCQYADKLTFMPAISRASIQGTRTSFASSEMFGLLGGTWQLVPASGGSCSVVIGDRSIQATCTNTNDRRANGTFAITFGDGIVSGSTDRGLEFSGSKR